LRKVKNRRVTQDKTMNYLISEILEFLANLTFMLAVMGVTFFVLTFFVECLCAGILLYLLKPLIKRI
jgi:predicted PurR-regulated permease PerM